MNMFEKVFQRIKGKKEMEMEIERLLSEGANMGKKFEEENIQMQVETSIDSDIHEGIEEVSGSIATPEDGAILALSATHGDSAMPEMEDEYSLLEELKHDDVASVEDEYGILKELEDVTAEELVEELNDLLGEMR